MIPERILTIFTGILLFIVMGTICWFLADIWKPEKVYHFAHPTHTQSAYEDLQRKEMYYEQKYKGVEKILLGL